MTAQRPAPRLEIERLEWDSDFFGLRVGRLRPDPDAAPDADELRSLARSGFDCVYVELAVAAAPSLGRWIEAGARLVDLRIELAARAGRHAPADPAPRPSEITPVDDWTAADRDAAIALAIDLSRWSRFRNDPAFAGSAERLYRGWIELAFSGVHRTLAWRDRGKIAGLLTYRVEPADAWIELLVVGPDHRGRGIGAGLVRTFLARVDGDRTPRVRTQLRNVGAIRIYEQAGFTIEDTTLVLHWWSP